MRSFARPAALIVGLVLPALLAPVVVGQPPTPASVTALAWMAGSWSGEAIGLAMEEHWTEPAGGTMIGMHRDVKGARTVLFEFLRIEERDGTLHYLASPKGAPPTTFPLKELGSERVVFENAAHDFPQRIIYWREGDSLHARVEGMVKGKLEGEEWTWRKTSAR
jgi:hypothetical protein